jgi:hypothetical protein
LGQSGGDFFISIKKFFRRRTVPTLKRRPFIRFSACKEDLSLESPEIPLPEAIASGAEPLLVVGAMAGG